jgi:hypothetical protein
LRRVGVSVQQLVCERGQVRPRARVGSVIAAGACVGGACANGLRQGKRAMTGGAEPQAQEGASGAGSGLELDRG